MSARIIDGRQLARRLRERFRERVTALATRGAAVLASASAVGGFVYTA